MVEPVREMVVESVRVHMLSSQHVVILREADAERYLPIWIGSWEAQSIAMRLQGVEAERPLTHDLMHNVLKGLGVSVERIVINDVSDSTFFARLILKMENELGSKILEVDARPSDSLVMALQAEKTIFVASHVFESAEDMSEILERVLRQQNEEQD